MGEANGSDMVFDLGLAGKMRYIRSCVGTEDRCVDEMCHSQGCSRIGYALSPLNLQVRLSSFERLDAKYAMNS